MTEKKTAPKKSVKRTEPEQDIQAGDQSIAVGGSVTDSAIIHGQTIVLADRFWRDLKPALPAEKLREATATYLAYLTDRHYYLSLKGMGISDRVPLKLKLLDLYVPLKARMELPEGDTWKRNLSLAGRDVINDDQELMHFGEPVPLLKVLQKHSGVIVLGDPGAGKTTFVKYLALRLA
ncbi:MAG: hypothetical protein Q7T89_16340, partial [Anaerolineales bacterium]|nr:hypothetical protein [Anaerolineales bacterium]